MDKELARHIGKAVVVSKTPDVCKSPTVPVPYMIVGKLDDSIRTVASVNMTKCPAFKTVSRVSTVYGNEAGVGGGVVSQVNKGMCKPIQLYSSTVKVEGNEVCRHDVLFQMNCPGPEGSSNTFGQLIYIEAIACATVGPAGEIVVDEDKSESSEESSPKDTPEGESAAADSDAAAADQAGDEGGFANEAQKRIGNELGGIKESAQGALDVLTDPQAQQEALDNVSQTAEAALENPVEFGKEAGGQILDDVVEPFGTAADQATQGNLGGAAASLGYGALNIFNPFKKLKILEKIGKLGKLKKKKKHSKAGGADSNGKDGGKVARRPPAKGSGHASERHGPNRDPKWKNKSQFNNESDIDKLIKESDAHPHVVQANGNHQITFDAGGNIGLDRATGLQTNTVTVITNPSGTVITAFPGVP